MLHHPHFNFTRTGGRMLAALLAAAVLGGCALQPIAPAQGMGLVAGAQSGRALDPALAAFIAQAPQGSVLALSESPWGSQVEVTTGERYFAASGRECRKLRLVRSATGRPDAALACQTAQGWEERRLVTEVIAGGQR